MVAIDESLLKNAISAYTNYTYSGSGKIQLPYYQTEEQVYGGKWLVDEITSHLQALGCDGKTTSEIQAITDNNPSKTGMDCSGLALNVTYVASSGEMLTYYANLIPGFPKDESDLYQLHYGITASALTSLTYCDEISLPENMKAGDFIRFNSGEHIGVIKSIVKNIDYTGHTISYYITYAHSSGGKGPHEATISVPEGQALNSSSALWSDWDSNYSSIIKSLFNYVCRPKA